MSRRPISTRIGRTETRPDASSTTRTAGSILEADPQLRGEADPPAQGVNRLLRAHGGLRQSSCGSAREVNRTCVHPRLEGTDSVRKAEPDTVDRSGRLTELSYGASESEATDVHLEQECSLKADLSIAIGAADSVARSRRYGEIPPQTSMKVPAGAPIRTLPADCVISIGPHLVDQSPSHAESSGSSSRSPTKASHKSPTTGS
jgi:hypothetical protein